MVSNTELVQLAQRGDVTSLGILLEHHRAPLYATALGILRNATEAEDAVQETFLIALRRIGQVRHADAIGGWLRAVLRSVCITHLRSTRPAWPLEGSAATTVPGRPETTAEAFVDRLALQDWVWTAIAELPEPLRVAAMLRYFGTNASYEEMASILGVPVGTVRSRLHQARNKLSDALLRTASLVHDEARSHAESEARFFHDAYDRYNRQRNYEALMSPLADDLVWSYADGTEQRQRAWPRPSIRVRSRGRDADLPDECHRRQKCDRGRTCVPEPSRGPIPLPARVDDGVLLP